jgi:hypothetical protein
LILARDSDTPQTGQDSGVEVDAVVSDPDRIFFLFVEGEEVVPVSEDVVSFFVHNLCDKKVYNFCM